MEVGGEALVEALIHVVWLGEDEGAPAGLLRDALVVRHVVELVVVLGPLVLRLGVPLGLALQQERFVQLVLGYRHLRHTRRGSEAAPLPRHGAWNASPTGIVSVPFCPGI